MIRGRTISRSLILMGSLACFLALAAPGAYGDGIVDGAGDAVPVDTTAVTSVTEDAPAVPEVPTVEDAGAVTDGATSTEGTVETVDEVVNTSSGAGAVEATAEVPTSTTETSDAAPSSSSGSGDTNAPATSSAGSETTSEASSTATEFGSSKSDDAASMTIASSSVTSMPPSERAALRGPSGAFVPGAARNPEDALDDLLGIGDTLGVDDVRGLQITSARGDIGDVPAPSSVPAPLALTGIAVGALAAIGLGLLIAGNGARAAGSGSIA